MTALSLRGVSKRFGATVALDGVDLVIAPAEVLAVIGENGAGKSTLMNIIAGAMRADSGEVRLARSGVAYIRQELSLFPHLSVAENIFMGREPTRFGVVDRAAMEAKTRTLLSEFGRPEIAPERRVSELSPAARQVVEICRALAADATLILMDEPTSSLQRADVDLLFAAIRELCARGIAILYVSHFLEEIREIASRAVVLRDGQSVWSGALDRIDDSDLISQMVSRGVETTEVGRRAPAPPGEVVLAVESVPGASLELRRGEILGIGGLVGSGRTELLRAIFGLGDKGLAGSVTLRAGRTPVRAMTPRRAIAQGLGYLSEDRNREGLFPLLSVTENLAMTRLGDRRIGRWVELLRIKAPDVSASIGNLSGGNQQKVLLARLLHQNAEVLLLDEPTRGVDVGSKAEIYEHIRRLAREGKAVLMVSSYLPELFELCDRLAVMSRGRLSESRLIGQWTPDSFLEAAIGDASAA